MTQARVLCRRATAELAPERFKFVDESGINLAMTRRCGRDGYGQRVADAVPKTHGPKCHRAGRLGLQGH